MNIRRRFFFKFPPNSSYILPTIFLHSSHVFFGKCVQMFSYHLSFYQQNWIKKWKILILQKNESKNIFASLQTKFTTLGRNLLTLLPLIFRRLWIEKGIEHITRYWESIRLCKLQHCRHRSRWGEVVFADGGTPSCKYDTRYCKILFIHHKNLSIKVILAHVDVIWYIRDECSMWKSFHELLSWMNLSEVCRDLI